MRKRHAVAAVAAVLVLVGGFGISQSGYADEIVVHVYDRAHHDYHNWDANEERVYRSYRERRHEAYREYRRISHRIEWTRSRRSATMRPVLLDLTDAELATAATACRANGVSGGRAGEKDGEPCHP